MLSGSVLLLAVLLTETSASSGEEAARWCPTRWHRFNQKCLAVYPVWSRWSTANSLCSQAGGRLASLHTPEDRKSVLRLLSSSTPVWVGRFQEPQSGSWFWCDDDSSSCDWTNQKGAASREEEASCKELIPQSGELRSADCGELRFYVCSTAARLEPAVPSSRTSPGPGVLPASSLFDVLWDSSFGLAEDILRSSCVVREFRSGDLTPHCYSRFVQQEALYLHRVSSTLEVLMNGLHEADDVKALLLDTLTRYSSNKQNLRTARPPRWLQFSLQSFHQVVLEDPVYWLVALSARVCLQNFLAQTLLSELGPRASDSEDQNLYQKWRNEAEAVFWLDRYRKVLEENQDQLDVYKAINIFRQHMMNEMRLHKVVTREDGEDEADSGWL